MVHRVVRVAAALTAVAVAAWLIPASIHIVGWSSRGPARIALFAPLWQLWWWLAGALVAAGVVAWREARAQRDSVKLSAALEPLGLLWLWVVPYLPWLPERSPGLLALSGPGRWVIAALALVAVALKACEPWFGYTRLQTLPGARAAFIAALGVYLGLGAWNARTLGPGADEPHYLVITQSLLKDHDLAIENNHLRGDYREYFAGTLRPDFLQRGRDEVIYSIHAPGVSALVAPAFAMFGYPGAVVTLAVFGALATVAVFELAAAMAGAGVAWLTWLAVALSVPFIPQAWLIFPEIPGAAIVAWGVLWLYRAEESPAASWFWRGIVLAVLPWLHTKFVVLLAAFSCLLALRLIRRPWRVVLLGAPIAVSAAAWLYSFYVLYGVFDPQIPYGASAQATVLWANLPRGILGLLIDQKFGLLLYAPVFCLSAWGLVTLMRDGPGRRRFGLETLAIATAFIGSTARYYMWWGGSSAPARFLTPAIPLLAPWLAVGFAHLRSRWSRVLAGLALGASVAVGIGATLGPGRLLLFSAPHGTSNLLHALTGGGALAYLLPTFTEEDLRLAFHQTAAWGAAALCGGALIAWHGRRRPRLGVALGLLACFGVGCVLVAAPPREARMTLVEEGRLTLLQHYDGPRHRGFDYARLSKLDETGVLASATATASRAAGSIADNPRQVAGSFDMPAGRYAARFWFTSVAPRERSLAVMVTGAAKVGEVAGLLASPVEVAFELPVGGPVSLAVGDAATAGQIERIELAASHVIPRSERAGDEPLAVEPMAGGEAGYLAYTDGNTYPEGGVFWTSGTATGRVLVVPATGTTLVLTLHVGPTAGRVLVSVDGVDYSADFARDETRVVQVPLSPGQTRSVVSVQSTAAFRPADVDPSSSDRRSLGCQVRVSVR